MSDLPDLPEYDDRETKYELEMPFVACESQRGPYEDVAFVAGFQVGRIDAAVQERRLAAGSWMVYKQLREQIDLVAMRHGYRLDVLYEDETWLHIGLTRIEP